MLHVGVLVVVVAASTILTASLAASIPPKLQILPDQPQIQIAVGDGFLLTCRPNVEKTNLITQLEWRDPKNRVIDITAEESPDSPLYIQSLQSEPGLALIFTKLSANLAGVYTCMAMYAHSEKLNASIEVNPYVDITWVNAPENQYPVAGQDYKIKCEVQASPPPMVTWFRNIGNQITSNERYIIENNGLTIKNVRESDDGVYICKAIVVSTGHIKVRNINVEVQVPPTIQPMKDIEVVEGEQASVECIAAGKPPPTYKWIKEVTREDLATTDRFNVKKNTGLLIINRVEFNDYSTYKCVAENNAGRREVSVKINVLVKPKIYELVNVTGVVNKDIRITCKAMGRPPPHITFVKLSNKHEFRDGPQDHTNRIIQEQLIDDQKGESYGSLKFSPLERGDDGLYQCIAKNSVNAAYQNGHIAVEFPPTFERTENFPPIWSWHGRPGNLTCIAESIPNATIEWRLGGMRLDYPTNNLKIYGNGPTSVLEVKPYNEPRFYGRYECVAKNKLGQASRFLELKMATPPQAIQQARAEDVTATTIKFNIVPPANLRGLPLFSISVQYVTERVPDWTYARNYTWTFNSPYILENLQPEETYNFRFAAANEVGIGPWTGNTQVQMPRRSVPAEPRIIADVDESNLSFPSPEHVVMSRFADHYEIKWNIPSDNGDPINSYILRYCVTKKVNGQWRDSETECSGEITQSSEYTNMQLNSLQPDTTYKVELRARNAIGLSTPAQIRVRTARGAHPRVYHDEGVAISSGMIIAAVVGVIVVVLVLVDLTCCCVNRAGILAMICDQIRSKPMDEEDPKLGSYKAAPAHPNSLNLPQPIKLATSPMDEKEPLKLEDSPPRMNGDKCTMSVEYDGKQVYSKSGEIIGKHSAV